MCVQRTAISHFTLLHYLKVLVKLHGTVSAVWLSGNGNVQINLTVNMPNHSLHGRGSRVLTATGFVYGNH